ncbi:hypothetical protein P9250_00220 [Caballeronia sp. LP006]|uniref:hypothetical protein n=1 Tax=Caballeronia sp. LP006 TaxID=3038552 RepID=UPI00285B096C|nr:hypothetical protein [Caballeronia sp. LP006]MDR5826277.1 hypothetical protein [Caballeronia sp. LP006]
MNASVDLIDRMSFRGAMLDSTSERARLVEAKVKELPPHNTLIRVEFAAFTDTDASRISGLPLSGQRKCTTSWYAAAGLVVGTEGGRLRVGERVVVTATGGDAAGWLGCSEFLRVCESGVARLPGNINAQSAALVGHPGYMAMLCVCSLEDSGGAPDKGPVLVTNPSSALGQAALLILDRLGYETDTIFGGEVYPEPSNVASSDGRWAAVIDTMGGAVLSAVISGLKYGGIAVVAGATDDDELKSSLHPFLFRAVRLVGIDAETTPAAERDRTWRRIAVDYPITSVDLLAARTVSLEGLESVSRDMVHQKQHGRVVVDLRA